MKKFTFLMALCTLCMGTPVMAQEGEGGGEETTDLWPVSFDKTVTKSTRLVTAVSLTSQKYGEQTANTGNSGMNLYDDLTETDTLRVQAGEEVSVSFTWNGTWMHGYVFIDTENDGFTAGIDETDGFTPTGDLFSYAFYNGDESDVEDLDGWNSVGDQLTGNARNVTNPPAFNAPATPGYYRMRLKVDWNSINPKGNEAEAQSIVHNNGQIIDVTLEVKPAPADITEVCAAANAALEAVGVGYPVEGSEARATLQAAIDNLLLIEDEATDADVETLYAAITAYKSVTTDIQLPEGGKLYSFTAVAKNGNRFYLDYTGEDVTIVAREAETEIPETAKFECVANEDGTFSFKTGDGNYLVYHSSYAGVSWLQGGGSTTGFQSEEDEMINVTIEKIANGGSVAPDSQADLFGLVTWKSARGFRNDNGNVEMGYMVIKTGTPTYDGSSAPFFNDTYSSAFLMEEYEKEVEHATAEIDPEPGDYPDGIPTHITMTFSKDMESVETVMVRTSVTYRGEVLAEDTYSLEGRTLTIDVPAEYLAGSEYMILMVEAKDVDGVYAEGGDGVGAKMVRVTYTTTLPHDTYVCTAVSPAESEIVPELYTIELTFTNENDEYDYIGGFNPNNEIVLQNEDGETVATATPSLDFDQYGYYPQVMTLTLDLDEPLRTVGSYTLVVPEKTVYNCDFDDSQDDFGEAWGALYNPAITLTFTIENTDGIGSVDMDTLQGKTVYSIDGRRVTGKPGRGIYIVNGKKVLVK